MSSIKIGSACAAKLPREETQSSPKESSDSESESESTEHFEISLQVRDRITIASLSDALSVLVQ